MAHLPLFPEMYPEIMTGTSLRSAANPKGQTARPFSFYSVAALILLVFVAPPHRSGNMAGNPTCSRANLSSAKRG